MFDLQKIARLSRLNLDDSQKKVLELQMREILTFVETLQQVDTSAIDGFGLPDSEMVFREDVVVSRGNSAEGIGLAPKIRDGMFLVPKIITGDEEA
jgi:aspartyl-tRNA(Asn)/glutamyl-tRNA(Gln) amidotransferase subunit C